MRRIRTGLLSLLMVLTGVAATFADDDKAKRDRDAAAALDLQLALAKKAAVAAAEAKPDSDTRIVIGYCVGKHCEITDTLSVDAADTAVQAAFEAAVKKALKATKTDADTLDEWSINADMIDPETGGMFIGGGDPSPGGVCPSPEFDPVTLLAPVASAGVPVSFASPVTFASYSFRTIADRPRLFRFDGDGPVRRVCRGTLCAVGRLFRR